MKSRETDVIRLKSSVVIILIIYLFINISLYFLVIYCCCCYKVVPQHLCFLLHASCGCLVTQTPEL